MDFFTSRFETIKNFLNTQSFPTRDWKNLVTKEYWTESFLETNSPYYFFSVILIIVSTVALAFWRLRIKKAHQEVPIYEPSLNQLGNVIAFLILISASYFFFRVQSISYLSSRLILLFSLIVLLTWLGWVTYYQIRIAPRKRAGYLEKERFFRYLPKKKTNDKPKRRR